MRRGAGEGKERRSKWEEEKESEISTLDGRRKVKEGGEGEEEEARVAGERKERRTRWEAEKKGKEGEERDRNEEKDKRRRRGWVGLEVNKCAIHLVGAIRCEQRKLIRNSGPFGLTKAPSLTQCATVWSMWNSDPFGATFHVR